MSFPTNCNKCGVPFHWDKNTKNPLPEDKRKKEFGWWVEDLSKLIHEMNRCKQLQTSGEFKHLLKLEKPELNPNSNIEVLGVVPTPRKVSELDQKVEKKLEEDAYVRTLFMGAKLRGVERACKELGITNGATIGMLFNAVNTE